MSWQVGLILVVIAACVLPWVFCEIADAFGPEDDWDHVAEQKRRNERNARRQSGEFQ